MSNDQPIQKPKQVKELKGPTVVRYEEATRFLWGDEESGEVSDFIYGGGSRISSFMYTLRPGGSFRWSKTWKPLYDQYRLYYVYQGMLIGHEPESGQIAVAQEGEAIYWQGNKYHFCYNFGPKEALILDVWAPGGFPLDLAEVEDSRQKPDLKEVVNGRFDLLGQWPKARPAFEQNSWHQGDMMTLRRADCLHVLSGIKNPILVDLFASTEEFTAGYIELQPAVMADGETHPGDEALFVTRGRLNVYLPDTYDWIELNPKDSFFIPEGIMHRYCNHTHEPVEFFFTVAPHYR
jgi:gentisate 1,2-dioxygenase